MRLYFLRHGDAKVGNMPDVERELTAEGIASAEIAGDALRKMEIPLSRIFSSPLVRAQQTARIVGGKASLFPILTSEFLAPGSDPQDLFKQLRNEAPDSHILLVGHEPFVSSAVSLLTTSSGSIRIDIRKASLTAIDASPALERGSCSLLWSLTPDHMRLMLG